MTKKQELHEILKIYVPKNLPNRAQLVRRLEALVDEDTYKYLQMLRCGQEDES